MTKQALEKMYRDYGIEGQALTALVQRDLELQKQHDIIFKRAIDDCQKQIDAIKKLKKAEKILRKPKA